MTIPLLYPRAVWRPVVSHGAPLAADMGVVEHITTNLASPYNYFFDPMNEASSHLWIAPDGMVEQYVDLRIGSWAQAGGNARWCSVELAGLVGTVKTAAQCRAFALLLAWGHTHPDLGWSLEPTDDPLVPGVGWHGMGAPGWGHPFCPGVERVEQTRRTVLPLARAFVQPEEEPDMTADECRTIMREELAKAVQVLHNEHALLLHGVEPPPGTGVRAVSLDAIARAVGVPGAR